MRLKNGSKRNSVLQKAKEEADKISQINIDLDKPFLGVKINTSDDSDLTDDEFTSEEAKTLNKKLAQTKNPLPNNIYSSATALKLAAILSEYDKQVVRDAVQLRNYVTNKLLLISDSGNSRDELRALELLGKISDVGLFVEKSEIKVTHSASEELENSLRGKIEKILKAKQFSNERAEIEEGEIINLTPEKHIPVFDQNEELDETENEAENEEENDAENEADLPE